MKENQILRTLVETLLKSGKPVWKKVAYELSTSRRKKIEVNLSKLDKYLTEKSVVMVPGKVLGSGVLSKKGVVAAFAFSATARKLIDQAGSKAVSIDSVYKSNPEGKGVIILK